MVIGRMSGKGVGVIESAAFRAGRQAGGGGSYLSH